MSTVKRAWLYIIRKKTRSLIMVLILFLIATALISSLTIKQGGAMMEKQMKQNIRSTFTLRQKEQQEHASIEEKTAEAIASSKNIQDRNFLLNGEAKLTEQEFVELPKGNITFNDSEKDPSDKSVRLIGNTDSSLNDSFLNKTMELKDGRHIQKTDENAALIHDSFAKKNHLGVGSEFALTDSTGTIQRMLHVAGIYTGKNEGVPLDTREMVENRIYTDLASAQSLTRQENLITEAVYRVDSPEHLDAVLQNIKSLPLSRMNWSRKITQPPTKESLPQPGIWNR